MRDYPKGGLIGKTVHMLRGVRAFQVPLHAANASFFLMLAVFPALVLLLLLLRGTALEVERLAEMLYGIFPEPLAAGAEEVILLTFDNTSGAMAGVSAATALWSASRGVYALLTGLDAVYGRTGQRGYWHIRLLSVAYMFAFLVLLLLTLGLSVFSSQIALLLEDAAHPGLLFLAKLINFRFWLLLTLQSGFFTAIFMALPGRNGLGESLPGAVLAALGWQIFSNLYSVYVEHFTPLGNIYGSVYAVSLSMLWLYCCMSILFYGGVLIVLLRENMSKS